MEEKSEKLYSKLEGKKILYLPEFDLEKDMVGRWRHLWPSKYLSDYGASYDIKGAMEPIIYRTTKEEREKNSKRHAVEINPNLGFNNTDNRAQAHILNKLKKDVDKSDVVVFGRTNDLFTSDVFDYAKKQGKVVGYEVDDLTFGRHGVFNKVKKFGDKPLSNYIEDQIKKADFVTVSTPYLKEEAAKLRKGDENVYLLKNRIDLESLEEEFEIGSKNETTLEDKIRIGWAGGKYHIDKLLDMKNVFGDLKEKYGEKLTFVFKGFDENNMVSEKDQKQFSDLKNFLEEKNIDYEFHGYTKSGDWKQYYKDLKDLNLDIFFAPSKNDAPHEAKSELKYLEASLIGAPIVVPKIGGHKHAIKHGENGYLIDAEEQEKGFFEGISYLIENPEKRKKISEAAKQDLIENYDVRKSSEELAEIFTEQLNSKEGELEKIIKNEQ